MSAGPFPSDGHVSVPVDIMNKLSEMVGVIEASIMRRTENMGEMRLAMAELRAEQSKLSAAIIKNGELLSKLGVK
jgi:hypothetical protein